MGSVQRSCSSRAIAFEVNGNGNRYPALGVSSFIGCILEKEMDTEDKTNKRSE